MNEYDTVEVLTEHPEFAPALSRGTRGVVVDLPAHSAVAAVEVGADDDVRVVLLDLNDLRQVAPARLRQDDPARDV